MEKLFFSYSSSEPLVGGDGDDDKDDDDGDSLDPNGFFLGLLMYSYFAKVSMVTVSNVYFFPGSLCDESDSKELKLLIEADLLIGLLGGLLP